jgi:type III secretion protein L
VNAARLRVHPEMVATAETALGEFESRTGLGKLARVVADETLAPDACLLESELGTIDASLGTQLQAINNAVTEAVRLMAPAGVS